MVSLLSCGPIHCMGHNSIRCRYCLVGQCTVGVIILHGVISVMRPSVFHASRPSGSCYMVALLYCRPEWICASSPLGHNAIWSHYCPMPQPERISYFNAHWVMLHGGITVLWARAYFMLQGPLGHNATTWCHDRCLMGLFGLHVSIPMGDNDNILW